MKYKVGDKVRVRIDLVPYEVYGSLTFLDGNMSKCAGQICTITEVISGEKYRVSENPFAWSEEMLKPADSKTLRMADGTIIGEFNTGGFCDGFRGGKIPNDLIVSPTEMERAMDRCLKILEKPNVKFGIKELEQKLKEEKKMPTKFTFYVTEGYRIDKSNNTRIPTMTTEVLVNGKDYQYGGCATCDKADYSERDGILNAIANAVCCGNFDREYEKFFANKKRRYDESCKCKICGRNYYEDEKTGKRTPFTPEDARKHEEWHEQNKKNKREKYLIRKEAKRRLAEAEREGKIEQTMKELYKK